MTYRKENHPSRPTEDTRSMQYARVLSKWIQCETVSVMGKVNPEKYRPFHKLMKETCPHLFEQMTVEDFDGSLLMHWPGKSSDSPLLLMSHHDVVEATGEWSHGPFSGEIENGVLWGRGTLDTKNSLWAMLQAAEELALEGFVPPRDVWFETACTEETDGSGAERIAKALKERGIHFPMVLDEGGYILHDPIGGADHDFAVVGVGEKGCADLKFIARSGGGHASAPGKDTPLVRLGKFMAAAEKSKLFRTQMNDVTKEMLRRCGKYSTGAMGLLLRKTNLFKPVLTRVMPAVSNTAGAMLKTTLAFTMAGGSEGSNVLPQEAWVIGNMRFSHHQGQKKSFKAIGKLAKKYGVEMEILDPGFESSVSDYRGEGFRLVEKTVSAVFGDVATVPYIMTGASDCRYFGSVSEQCLRFSPFAVTDEQLDTIHGIDENINIDQLPKAVDFYKMIIKSM